MFFITTLCPSLQNVGAPFFQRKSRRLCPLRSLSSLVIFILFAITGASSIAKEERFTMMVKLGNLVVAITVLVVQALAVDAGYNIIARGDSYQRHLQAPSASPQVISFDGDLDKIIALALERAGGFNPDEFSSPQPTMTPAPTITPSPTFSPVHSPNVCEGADLTRLELFKWKYTIETVAQADINTVIGGVEEMLQERLVPLLLSCNAESAANASIVAIDCTLPLDTISIEGEFV